MGASDGVSKGGDMGVHMGASDKGDDMGYLHI